MKVNVISAGRRRHAYDYDLSNYEYHDQHMKRNKRLKHHILSRYLASGTAAVPLTSAPSAP
jgi:hypothetical protein